MNVLDDCFNRIITPYNIWRAWRVYRRGKREHPAVREFERRLEENLWSLLNDLSSGAYKHGPYFRFIVHDPKERLISVPTVRDHVVHQALMLELVPFWEMTLSPFSFSCRKNKGTHRARDLFWRYVCAGSRNGSRPVWVLHGDVKKCFDSISHGILEKLVHRRIVCRRTRELVEKIVASFSCQSSHDGQTCGIPLGNLMSQLFINIYLDPLDRFVKETLKAERYVRYADDFLLVLESKEACEKAADAIRAFLFAELGLSFPPSHEWIRGLKQGIETMGARFTPYGIKIRPKTEAHLARLWRRWQKEFENGTISFTAFDSHWQSVRSLVKWIY